MFGSLDNGETQMQTFEVIYANDPRRNRRFKVRGICEYDVLNPCWDNRRDDVPGKHWGGDAACAACTAAASRKPSK